MSITSKRKAQDLVREGKINDAIAKLREGLADGDADPYDHVYLGDLLMRVGETESCLAAYQAAIRSYEDVGLYRNAVAIAKKMLRIDGRRPEIHRCLASLYDREGLHGEAVPHYLTYLDSFVGEEVPPTEFLETLDQAAAITGSKVEIALRLTEHFIRIRRVDRAAALLEDVAANAEVGGSLEMAADLRQRARDLLGTVAPNPVGNGAVPPHLPAVESTAELGSPQANEAYEPGFPPPPPLGEVERSTFDPSALETTAAEGPPSLEHDESGPPSLELDDLPGEEGAARTGQMDEPTPFVLEHFAGSQLGLDGPGSETPDDDQDSDAPDLQASSVPQSDLEFGEVDLSVEPAPPGRESTDHSAFPGASPPRPKTTVMAFDADAFDSAPPVTDDFGDDDLGEDHVYEIELEEVDAAGFELTPVSAPGTTAGETSAASVSAGDDVSAAEDIPSGEFPSLRDDESHEDGFASNGEPPVSGGSAPAGPPPIPGTEASPWSRHDDAEGTSGDPDAAPPGKPAVRPGYVPVTIEEANDAFLEGRWSEARRLYERILEDEPDNRRILARLVETVRYLQDHHGEVHYLVQLGEVWIAEEELEEALECFLKVVRLDPENSTAKRRLSRFREMGIRGAEAIEESDSNSVHGVLETGRTEVTVRDSEENFRSEDWVELEGLLEEFKDGLKSQMDEEDYQGHYDLAVSYHGMGLLEEALEAADRALLCEKIPLGTERLARELKGSCLNELHRYREAVHEYREAVEKAGSDRQARRTALYHLARSLEALEEWQEAVHTYVQLKLEAPGFLDVEERIRTCEGEQGGSSSSSPSEAA